MGVLNVLGVIFLQGDSCKEIYRDPNSGTLGIGSLYLSGFFLGLFEAYCTMAKTWGGLEEQFRFIEVMAKWPLTSFLLGFLGAIIFWMLFTVIGVFLVGRREGSVSLGGVGVVTACASVPLGITVLFPVLDYLGVKFVFGIPLGWLITLVAFVWTVVVEIRAIFSIP